MTDQGTKDFEKQLNDVWNPKGVYVKVSDSYRSTFNKHLRENLQNAEFRKEMDMRCAPISRLCFVDESETVAYFTTQELCKQWGDDWNDRPYQYNAGIPYSHYYDYEDVYFVYEVHFRADLWVPAIANYNSGPGGWSVEQMNRGELAWLVSDAIESRDAKFIMAGTTLKEFFEIVDGMGGTAFQPVINLATNEKVFLPHLLCQKPPAEAEG